MLYLTAPVQAQLGGQTAFPFLNLVGSARSAALGGNQLAVKDDDLNLAIYNPSLLTSGMDQQLAMSYVNYFSSVNYGYAAYAKDVDSLATFHASIQYFDYGQFSTTDPTGLELGTFIARDYTFAVGAGKTIDSLFSLGANLKFIYSALESYFATGVAIDLSGTYASANQLLTASLLIRNLGWQLSSYTEENREELPFEIQLGLSKRLKHAPLRLFFTADNLQQWDLTYENANTDFVFDPITGELIEEKKKGFGDQLMRHVLVGGEILLTENFNVRLGYNYRRRQELKISDKPGTTGLSWGVGLRISKFHLSYGRATYHLAGASNHFTLTTNLKSFREKRMN